MNRATGLGIVGLLLLMAGVGYFRPDFFPGLDAPKFAWL